MTDFIFITVEINFYNFRAFLKQILTLIRVKLIISNFTNNLATNFGIKYRIKREMSLFTVLSN